MRNDGQGRRVSSGRLKKKGGSRSGYTSFRGRKERRKEERKSRKAIRFEHFRSKFSNQKKQDEEDPVVSEKEDFESKRMEEKEKREAVKRAKMDALERERRVQQLEEANQAEEAHIRSLEKKLRIRKRGKKEKVDDDNNKKLPKSFMEDGLDYLINFLNEDHNDALDDDDEDDDRDQVVNESKDVQADEVVAFSADEVDADDDDDHRDDVEVESEEEEEPKVESDNDLDIESNDEAMSVDDEELAMDDKNIEEEQDDEDEGTKRCERSLQVPSSSEDALNASLASEPASKYIPPALRSSGTGSSHERIRKQVQGQLNRLAFHNMATIARQLEHIYTENSRGIVTEVIIQLMEQSLLLHSHVVPERLMLEHALLLVILHNNVAVEIGAQIVHFLVHTFEKHYTNELEKGESSKILENLVMLLCHLHAFKVVSCHLIFDLIHRLSAHQWTSKDVECLVCVLRSAGFALRKEDPGRLKTVFMHLRSRAKEVECEDTRIRFMIEAIKNNNVNKAKKTAGDDLGQHKNELSKMLKVWLKSGTSNMTTLNCRWEQVSNASTSGRWWLLGNGWKGDETQVDNEKDSGMEHDSKENAMSQELLDLARKMRMNTETRKAIFCVVMSAEDPIDCHEKLLRMSNKKREREIAFVLIDCAIQERLFNTYYSHVLCSLCSSSRSFRMATQCCLWDKFKVMEDFKHSFQLDNLSALAASLITKRALTLTCLKVIDFATVQKKMVNFLKSLLNKVLDYDQSDQVFSVISGRGQFKMLREGLRLFMSHFMMKEASKERQRLIENAEQIIMARDDHYTL